MHLKCLQEMVDIMLNEGDNALTIIQDAKNF